MNLLNKFICLCRGHKWRIIRKKWEEFEIRDEIHPEGVLYWEKIFEMKCARCGKTKEEVI